MSSLAPWTDAKTLLTNAALGVPIQYPNDGTWVEPDPSAGLWLSVQMTGDVLFPIELGANAWQEEGRLFVHVMSPAGTGTEAARTLAKSVANVFRGLGPRLVVYKSASIGSGVFADPEGVWWSLAVTIDW